MCPFLAESFDAFWAPAAVGEVVNPVLLELRLCGKRRRAQGSVRLYFFFGAFNDLIITLKLNFPCRLARDGRLPSLRKTTSDKNIVGRFGT